ncbi:MULTISPECIES: putative bifunctional diguanylate cyclase/phosphodiesterase [Citrobacter]|uniref:putative bifunctional diguanylate cyclase/phosphodiesterase n=1 Tax=Citrobacter TaxID=544 RepID=UPI001F2577DD|nr:MULTISPECIES: EAL domain-containing protein [Citrobacter]EHG7888160.1 EAL domain-containing protein [Citrobacter braakii]MCF2472667.1 EAL domain-containing protein [Citrobacter braakii]MDU2843410.1 EAL domain-containing protein [Citrobacter sp.]WFV21713.1 EAL domain-containing protein [Citrobacter braakii]
MFNSSEVLTALEKALNTSQLYMVYQPIFNLRNQRISGFEALMRWNSPQMGMISPDVFITLLEDSGNIISIEDMVTHTPWDVATRWPEPLVLSVNISALEFCDPLLPQRVRKNLTVCGLPPHRCQIEVTETSPLCDSQVAAKNMTELKAIGVKIALDDFGTGHANLNYLLKYPFDTLKIDKEFIAGIEPDTRSTKIVEGIISLAHNFGIEVLAEGVETQSELDRLMQIGCDKIQGFFISPPVLAEEIPLLLTQYNP